MSHAVATIVSVAEASSMLAECMATLILPISSDQNLVDGPTKDKLVSFPSLIHYLAILNVSACLSFYWLLSRLTSVYKVFCNILNE